MQSSSLCFPEQFGLFKVLPTKAQSMHDFFFPCFGVYSKRRSEGIIFFLYSNLGFATLSVRSGGGSGV